MGGGVMGVGGVGVSQYGVDSGQLNSSSRRVLSNMATMADCQNTNWANKCDILINVILWSTFMEKSLFLWVRLNKRHTPAMIKQETLPQCRWNTCIVLLSHFSIWSVLHGLKHPGFYRGNYQWTRRAAVACRPVDGGGGGSDSKVASLTPQTIWGPRGRWGCGGRMKSTLVIATPWPYVRFSDTGQLPLNPAVCETQKIMFISQESLTGCTNGWNFNDDSSKTKCASVDFKVGSSWWIGATEVKLEGTWKSMDEYWATASLLHEYRTPLLAKVGKTKQNKTWTFGKTEKTVHINHQMCPLLRTAVVRSRISILTVCVGYLLEPGIIAPRA